MSIFNLYHDAALTNPIEAGDPLVTEHNADGSTGRVDVLVYFGSPDATKQAQANSDPGVVPRLSGAANAVPVWVGVTEGAQSVTNWSDLSLQTNQLKVTAI